MCRGVAGGGTTCLQILFPKRSARKNSSCPTFPHRIPVKLSRVSGKVLRGDSRKPAKRATVTTACSCLLVQMKFAFWKNTAALLAHDVFMFARCIERVEAAHIQSFPGKGAINQCVVLGFGDELIQVTAIQKPYLKCEGFGGITSGSTKQFSMSIRFIGSTAFSLSMMLNAETSML